GPASPISLFPYTTLFRSVPLAVVPRCEVGLLIRPLGRIAPSRGALQTTPDAAVLLAESAPRTRAAQPAAGQGHAQEASASVVIGNAGTSGSTALFAHQDDAGEDQDDHHRTDAAANPPPGRTRI